MKRRVKVTEVVDANGRRIGHRATCHKDDSVQMMVTLEGDRPVEIKAPALEALANLLRLRTEEALSLLSILQRAYTEGILRNPGGTA